MTQPDTDDRLLTAVRRIVETVFESHRVLYSGVYEYSVVVAAPGVVDLVPTGPIALPPLSRVPLRPGLQGEVVTPTVGQTALVAFVNSDPTRPIVVSLDGNPLLIQVGAVPLPLAKGPPTTTALTAIGAYIAAVTAAAVANPTAYTPFAAAIVTAGGTVATALALDVPLVNATTVQGT